MYRERVLLLGVSLAVFASLGALGGMGYLSWQSGLRQEQAHLQRYAAGAIARTRDAFTEIDEAFDTLSRSNAVPCSPRHIEELRLATLDTRSAEDVAYFRDGRLLCSSWGALRGHIPRAASDFTTGDTTRSCAGCTVTAIAASRLSGVISARLRLLGIPAA